MYTYQQKKAAAIEKAMDWQSDFPNHSYTWGEIAYWQEYFETVAKRYGLVREFKENGII